MGGWLRVMAELSVCASPVTDAFPEPPVAPAVKVDRAVPVLKWVAAGEAVPRLPPKLAGVTSGTVKPVAATEFFVMLAVHAQGPPGRKGEGGAVQMSPSHVERVHV